MLSTQIDLINTITPRTVIMIYDSKKPCDLACMRTPPRNYLTAEVIADIPNKFLGGMI